jgi:uncharacterized protein (DUF169 family)
MALSCREMEDILMQELRLYHHPIAVTWMFTDAEVVDFARKTPHCRPVKPLTFCQWEIAARMQGKTVLGRAEDLDCSGGLVSFGWRDAHDPRHLKTLSGNCLDTPQIERFMRAKPRMETDSLKAVAVGPLGRATAVPHVVHFYCDAMQAYHLSVDYMAATDTPALRPIMTGAAASCGGAVFSWQEDTFNLCPACSGNFNAGKMERGELNVFIPGDQIEAVVDRLSARINKTGGSSVTRPGEPFPGSDICKNCPQILFREGKA